MQDEYPADEGARLRRCCSSETTGPVSARLFLCAGCRAQAIVCACCDRGQVYCPGDCARQARRRTIRAAGRRYQRSPRGRRAHAARMGRWRARQERVTHHGSPRPSAGDLLPVVAMTPRSDDASPAERRRSAASHCHWCGRRCLPLLRVGFLRRRRRHRGRAGQDRAGPTHHGDAA
jgi:hypothetical protein